MWSLPFDPHTYDGVVAARIANGEFAGLDRVQKFGRNDAVGTSFVPIAMGGVWQTPQVASATTLRVKAGGNANDTAAGTGARSIFLQGLDETGAETSETLATAGASASSATTTTFLRLYRSYVATSGTYATMSAGSHAGDIVIENGAGGTDWLTLDSTDIAVGQSEIACYTIPLGKTGYIWIRSITVDTAKSTDLVLFQRQNILQTAAPYSAMRGVKYFTGLKQPPPLGSFVFPFGPFPALTDIVFMGKVDVGTASIETEFEILLMDD